MGAGKEGLKYILIVRDDASGYVWLFPGEFANSGVAAETLAQWYAMFGGFEWLVTDQGAHFKNELIKNLSKELFVKHHFTTAYSPWANGTVERVCREVLRACKALLHEFRLASNDWPAVTECLQSVINHAPLTRLGLRDPAQPGSIERRRKCLPPASQQDRYCVRYRSRSTPRCLG